MFHQRSGTPQSRAYDHHRILPRNMILHDNVYVNEVRYNEIGPVSYVNKNCIFIPSGNKCFPVPCRLSYIQSPSYSENIKKKTWYLWKSTARWSSIFSFTWSVLISLFPLPVLPLQPIRSLASISEVHNKKPLTSIEKLIFYVTIYTLNYENF
jgi:hypothetical protein